jgi:alanyl-tRNA synthetase
VQDDRRVLNGVPGKDLKGMADEYKKKLGSGVVALIGVEDGKASAVVGVTDDLAKSRERGRAGQGRRRAARRQGRRRPPDMAQGGGPTRPRRPRR